MKSELEPIVAKIREFDLSVKLNLAMKSQNFDHSDTENYEISGISAETKSKIEDFLVICETTWKPRFILALSPFALLLWPFSYALQEIFNWLSQFVNIILGSDNDFPPVKIWRFLEQIFSGSTLYYMIVIFMFCLMKFVSSLFIEINRLYMNSSAHRELRKIHAILYGEEKMKFIQWDLILSGLSYILLIVALLGNTSEPFIYISIMFIMIVLVIICLNYCFRRRREHDIL